MDAVLISDTNPNGAQARSVSQTRDVWADRGVRVEVLDANDPRVQTMLAVAMCGHVGAREMAAVEKTYSRKRKKG